MCGYQANEIEDLMRKRFLHIIVFLGG